MKQEYDFRNAKRGAVIPQKGKTRITIYIDDDIINEFRNRAEMAGKGYQTIINDALREYIGKSKSTLDEDTLRRVIRKELKAV
ncbi:MAG: BrnA antitoxin family protein [Deltaproteobacteria bacterium]|nr:BrnA antitoxin family protein [Deltaproteobacteria bacterium]